MSLHRPDAARHIAQFYERDEHMVANVAYLARETLRHGDSVALIATPAHLSAMEKLIGGAPLDLERLRTCGRYVALDAAETLSAFKGDRWPDEAKFEAVVGGVVRSTIENSANGFVFAFGEMVALMCAENQRDAAIRLEQLWNILFAEHRFSLYCAYPLTAFGDEPDIDALLSICSEHSLAIPAESPDGSRSWPT